MRHLPQDTDVPHTGLIESLKGWISKGGLAILQKVDGGGSEMMVLTVLTVLTAPAHIMKQHDFPFRGFDASDGLRF